MAYRPWIATVGAMEGVCPVAASGGGAPWSLTCSNARTAGATTMARRSLHRRAGRRTMGASRKVTSRPCSTSSRDRRFSIVELPDPQRQGAPSERLPFPYIPRFILSRLSRDPPQTLAQLQDHTAVHSCPSLSQHLSGKPSSS